MESSFTNEAIDAILQDLDAPGNTLKKISEKYGVPISTLSVWRSKRITSQTQVKKKKSYPKSIKTYSQKIKDNAIRLFKMGIPRVEISNRLDVNYKSVFAWTKDLVHDVPQDSLSSQAKDLLISPLPGLQNTPSEYNSLSSQDTSKLLQIIKSQSIKIAYLKLLSGLEV